MEAEWPEIRSNSNVISALLEIPFLKGRCFLTTAGLGGHQELSPLSLVTHTVLGSPLILHPQPTVSGRAQSPHMVLQKHFLVALPKSLLMGTEESSLPPQGSGIRGVKQETGSKSSSSSLSCLSHNWVPPGWSLCLTLSLCHPSPVSLSQVTAGEWEGGSSVGSECFWCFLGKFWTILQSRTLQRAQTAGLEAGEEKEEEEGGHWGCFIQRNPHV